MIIEKENHQRWWLPDHIHIIDVKTVGSYIRVHVFHYDSRAVIEDIVIDKNTEFWDYYYNLAIKLATDKYKLLEDKPKNLYKSGGA